MSQDGFYTEAASIVEAVRSGKGRVKSLCYNSRHRNKKGLLALVSETCKNYDILEKTMRNSGLFKSERKTIRPGLAIVLIHDLVNDRNPACSAKLWDPISRNKTRIRAEYVKLRIRQPVQVTVRPWRYARINTIITSVEECCQELQRLGYEVVDDELPEDGKKFTHDAHIRSLIAFPPGTDLTRTSVYRRGEIILQDKASCMPVEVLDPPAGASVIDACAAPGNKTTQLAAAVGPAGRIYAFERDPKRYMTLQSTLQKHTRGNVSAKCMDFLQMNPAEFADVEYCLVDPSCSGSGMLDDFEDANSGRVSGDRLRSLSNFQCMIVRHAMKLPNLKRIVYSTCSVHKEENEEVVKQVLEAEPAFKLVKSPLPLWRRRGLEQYEDFCTQPFFPTSAYLWHRSGCD